MAKGLRSYPEKEREAVALRRLKNKTNGNGYWAAVDYIRKVKKLPKDVQ